MELKRILEIAGDLQNSGVDCYIIKETVHDMLLKKKSNKVQMVVQFSLSKIEEYFKANDYQIKSTESDLLIANIEGTRFEVRTLKYITQDEFFTQIICTDFTANTLIMKSDESLLDIFGAINSIQNRELIPCEGFDISRKNFDFGFYNDLINKIYQYGYKADTDYLPDIFSYLSNHADKLKPNAKKNIIDSVMDYCTDHDCTDTYIKNFLNIKVFYKRITPEKITQEGINKLAQLPKEIVLMTLLYLYGYTKEDFPGVNLFSAICDYVGTDLSSEINYDNAYTTYGFEVVNEIVVIQGVIAELEGKSYNPPKYHHKSVFSQLERLNWKEAPIIDDISEYETTTFSDVSKTIDTTISNGKGYKNEIKSYASNLEEEAECPVCDVKSKIAKTIKKNPLPLETFDSTNAGIYFESQNMCEYNADDQNEIYKKSIGSNMNNPILNNPDYISDDKSSSDAASNISIIPMSQDISDSEQMDGDTSSSLDLDQALRLFDENNDLPDDVNQSIDSNNNTVSGEQCKFNESLKDKFNTIILKR